MSVQRFLIGMHPWSNEANRLYELYYCLLHRISKKNEVQIRRIIKSLAALNLLDANLLSEAKIVGGDGGEGDSLASTITEILIRNGFKEEEARSCSRGICTIARGIKQNYEGKVQKFLRKYGNLMIEEMDKLFSFEGLSKDDREYVFAHWLQNSLQMPVPLAAGPEDRFYKDNSIKEEDLLEFADKLDITVPLVNDVIRLYNMSKPRYDAIKKQIDVAKSKK
jgi:hypothetical protein